MAKPPGVWVDRKMKLNTPFPCDFLRTKSYDLTKTPIARIEGVCALRNLAKTCEDPLDIEHTFDRDMLSILALGNKPIKTVYYGLVSKENQNMETTETKKTTLPGVIKFSKIAMQEYGCIAVKYDFTKVWKTFEELPIYENVRFFLINDDIRAGKYNACLVRFHIVKPSLQKLDVKRAYGVLADLLENYDSILSGEYVSKIVRGREKAEATRKKRMEEMD